jgi:hypothetical protein
MNKIGQGFKKQTTINNFICIKMKNSVDANVKAIIFILIIIISTICGSCNEELVEPPPPPPPVEPDTVSRYVWYTYKTVVKELYNIYAADTNLVYIQWSDKLIYWNGVQYYPFHLNDNNFRVTNLYGYGKDILFVSGYKILNGLDIPYVKKVVNGAITDIMLDSSEGYIGNHRIIGPDEAWFSSFLTNVVYHYKNGGIKKYKTNVNDSLRGGAFYSNANGDLFLSQVHLSSTSNKTKSQIRMDVITKNVYTPGTLYNFKFQDDSFNLISTQCYNPYDINCSSLLISQCGNDALMVSFIDKISIFNGSSWEKHSSFDTIDTFAQRIGGISKDSLVAFTLNFGSLYTYNGKKWRYENNSPLYVFPSLGFSNVEAKFGNIYFCYYSSLSNDPAIFYVGRPNKLLK